MKLFKVSFPDILVAAYSEEDLHDQIDSSTVDCEYYNDLSEFSAVEITNEQQVDDFNDHYIPYGQLNSELTLDDFIKLVDIMDKLDEQELELLKNTFQNE